MRLGGTTPSRSPPRIAFHRDSQTDPQERVHSGRLIEFGGIGSNGSPFREGYVSLIWSRPPSRPRPAGLAFQLPLDPPAGGEFNIQPVALRLTIGDFSRMTHLSVKALRHYHQIGLLEPVAIDPDSGYRLYDSEQVPQAQVIKRLKDLGMPLDEIALILQAPDLEVRNQAIVDHLKRMEDQLE